MSHYHLRMRWPCCNVWIDLTRYVGGAGILMTSRGIAAVRAQGGWMIEKVRPAKKDEAVRICQMGFPSPALLIHTYYVELSISQRRLPSLRRSFGFRSKPLRYQAATTFSSWISLRKAIQEQVAGKNVKKLHDALFLLCNDEAFQEMFPSRSCIPIVSSCTCLPW